MPSSPKRVTLKCKLYPRRHTAAFFFQFSIDSILKHKTIPKVNLKVYSQVCKSRLQRNSAQRKSTVCTEVHTYMYIYLGIHREYTRMKILSHKATILCDYCSVETFPSVKRDMNKSKALLLVNAFSQLRKRFTQQYTSVEANPHSSARAKFSCFRKFIKWKKMHK